MIKKIVKKIVKKNTKKNITMIKTPAVLVTTLHKGVFFGYLVGKPTKEKVVLKNARNCVSWTNQEKGFLGLAEAGPSTHCRIGPAVKELTIWDITGVATCSAKAISNWEKAPWEK